MCSKTTLGIKIGYFLAGAVGFEPTKKLSLKREMLKKNTLNYLNNAAEPISPV